MESLRDLQTLKKVSPSGKYFPGNSSSPNFPPDLCGFNVPLIEREGSKKKEKKRIASTSIKSTWRDPYLRLGDRVNYCTHISLYANMLQKFSLCISPNVLSFIK